MIGILSTEEIEEVLKENVLGRIGCNDGIKTYVVPVNYVYNGTSIIAHSAEGLKIKMMRENKEVCFEVDDIKSYTNWRSVIAWGYYQELLDERDRYNAMKLFVERMLHVKVSESAIVPGEVEKKVHSFSKKHVKPVIYRIVLTEKTGRFERE
ncbi:MAG TPA: pyridoxamine 5'-phosphate oxidase family protein [Chitinophagaceae bacterium]|nr:pyridoxamine 5'-phosphate oxidase family protein [Chitinophagaceae bacterium]